MFVKCANSIIILQEGVTDPPSVSSINRLLRGPDRRDDDGRKDYSIHGILGGKLSLFEFLLSFYFKNVLFNATSIFYCVKSHALAHSNDKIIIWYFQF